MTNLKISQLSEVTDVQDADEHVLVRSGVNYRIAASNLLAGAHGLPTGWYNVATAGLVDDSSVGSPGTDNSAALTTLLATIPTAAAGEAAIFVWPKTQGKSYGFSSSVNWGNRSIKNIGLGSAAWDDQRGMTSIMALSDGITMFDIDAGSGATSYFHGPTFENFAFTRGDTSFTTVTGMRMQRITRCTLRRCLFYLLNVGLEMNENTIDCAWHKLYDCVWNQCNTGWHSTSCNSIDVFSPDIISCGVGFDLDLANQIQIYGGKVNTPVATTGIGGGNPAIGMRIGSGSVTVLVDGTSFELGDGSSARTAIDLKGDNCTISEIGLHGGSGTGQGNIGVKIESGANSNRVSWRYATGFDDNAHICQNSGLKNQINYGAYVDTTANLPASADITRLGTIRHNLSTGATQIANGTSWVSLGGPVSIVAKTADQSVNNSTTLVDDNHLKITLLGDSTSKYLLECFLLIDAVDASCDIKLGFTTAVATVRWAGLDGNTVTPSWGGLAVASTGVLSNTAATTISYGTVTAGSTEMPLSLAAYVADGGTSGDVKLRWAQNTAVSGNLTLKTGSFMRITKIA